jgi:ABC-type branched-subunit amino acid transport system substrate-binding protein
MVAVLTLLSSAPSWAATPLTVRIAFIGPVDGDAHAGAAQGIKEANAQGKFLGLDYELVRSADADAALAAQASAVVADAGADALPALATAVRGLPVLNVHAEDDALRTQCIANLFHTIPSQAMRVDALAQWRKKQPDNHAAARAWDAGAEMYAGSQLNKRYSDGAGRAMNDQAWAAWAAVKLLSDTVARLRSVEPTALLGALRKDLAFDGQKGVDMSFRDNGQLRQPLLLVEDGKIVGEAPVRGVAANGDLDSLGNTSCAR